MAEEPAEEWEPDLDSHLDNQPTPAPPATAAALTFAAWVAVPEHVTGMVFGVHSSFLPGVGERFFFRRFQPSS